MFGRKKIKKLTRKEKLQLKAAYAAGQVGPRLTAAASTAASKVGPHVSRVAGAAAQKVGPPVGRARDYAGPRAAALASTAAVALAPRVEQARARSGAALGALRGVPPAIVVKQERRWPIALGSMVLGMIAGVAAKAFAQPAAATFEAPSRPVPTVIPTEDEVVILDDVRATTDTTTTMPTRED